MASENATQNTSEIQTREKQTVAREGTRPGLVFRPDIDIVEGPEEFLVFADLPGVDEEHVDVRLENGVLSIDGTLAVEPDVDWTGLHTEYRFGNYHREFNLSEAIETDGIEATMCDGVLELHLPKSDRHRPRQIEVRAG